MGFDISTEIESALEDAQDEIEDAAKVAHEQHMAEQPYSVTCATCENVLEFAKRTDVDDDLFVDVQPCRVCMAKAVEEATK